MDRMAARRRGLSPNPTFANSLAGHAAPKLKTIGITGASGKTTTSCLVASVLAAGGYRSGVICKLGYFDGEAWIDAVGRTSNRSALDESLARMSANGCTHAVLEVSSEALTQHEFAGVELDVAGVTNVPGYRLDVSGTRQSPPDSPARLFDYLAPEGFALINTDDAAAERLLARVDGPVLSVGMDGSAEISATPVEQCASEQTFLLTAGDETFAVRTPLIGTHNITNCLMAAAVGLVYSIDLATIVAGLEAIQRVPGRLDRLECGQPFSVFVDEAHTPESLSASLNTLREVTRGRLICVFGAGGGRTKSNSGILARAVEAIADLGVVTSDRLGHRRHDSGKEAMATGFEERAAAHAIDDRRQAIAWALEQAQPGDCVLIAGGAQETHPLPGEGKLDFDDREIARRWLYESLPAISRAA